MPRSTRTSRVTSLAAVAVVAGSALVTAAGVVAAGSARAQVLGDRLLPGTTMVPGDSLRSPNGVYSLVLQDDGNLVVYAGSRALWNTVTAGRGGNRLVLQSDGNLVLYKAAGGAAWASYTFSPGPTALTLRDNGGLVALGAGGAEYWGQHLRSDLLPAGGSLRVGQTLWARSAQYRLTLQSDGNLVLYSVTDVPVWYTRTSGTMSAVTAQSDGDVVLRRTDGSVAWHSGTTGSAGAALAVTDDAFATVANTGADGTPTTVWSSPAQTGVIWRNQGLRSGAALTQGTTQLIMQTDGNLVRYVGTTAAWSTKTSSPGAVAAMQRDGNLVVYSAAGAPLWSSKTSGTAATYLRLSTGAGLTFLGNAGRAPSWVEGPPNWAGLAQCESGGNPRAVNPAGYYGLYQFDLRTWTSNGGTGNPVDATPAVQTAVAATLYLARGRQPWPTCGKYL